MVYDGEGDAGNGGDDIDVAAALTGGDGGGDAGGEGGGGGDGGGDAGGDPEWLEKFSAEGGDADNPSNRDWLKSKGFKSLDDVAKSYREAEQAIRNGGKLTIPGEGAKAEEIAAFHKAIGVPDTPEGYEVKVPEGQALDEDLVTPLRAAALKAGVPKAGFEALADALVAHQLDTIEAIKTAEDGDLAAWKKAQGDQVTAKLANVNSAARLLGITPVEVQGMQRGLHLTTGKPGSSRVLDILDKIGAGMAEDVLHGGDGRRNFGITGAEAQVEIDRLIKDREFGEKLSRKDPDAVARWTRLNGAVAADRDRKARAEASS